MDVCPDAPSMNEAPAPTIGSTAARALRAPLTDLVARAGAAILAISRDAMRVDGKADGSPVTDADLAADRVIAQGLAEIAPQVPVLSEERTDLASRPFKGSFFIVDPLDGTREFLAGRNEFTVNIALVTDGRPLLGIVGAPALGLIWRGLVGEGAERLAVGPDGRLQPPVPIRTRRHPAPGAPWIATVSRSHGDPRSDAFIAARPAAVRHPLGSAVKFCCVAEGGADVYPRLAPTSEWDVAAGHAVLTAAGGKVTDGKGGALRFGEACGNFLVPQFIAWGDPAAATQ